MSWSFCTIIMLVMKTNASIFYDKLRLFKFHIYPTAQIVCSKAVCKNCLFIWYNAGSSNYLQTSLVFIQRNFVAKFCIFILHLHSYKSVFDLIFIFATLNYPWDLWLIYLIPLHTNKTIVNLLTSYYIPFSMITFIVPCILSLFTYFQWVI